MRIRFWAQPTRAERIHRNIEHRFGVKVRVHRSRMYWEGRPGWEAWASGVVMEQGFGGSAESALRHLHRRLSRRRRGLHPDTMVAHMHEMYVRARDNEWGENPGKPSTTGA